MTDHQTRPGNSWVFFGVKTGMLAGAGVGLALVIWFLVVNNPPTKVDTGSVRTYGPYLLINAAGWSAIGAALGCSVGAAFGAIAGMFKRR
jgi:hypothetical protein